MIRSLVVRQDIWLRLQLRLLEIEILLLVILLDTGQRDSYYDLGRASRKPNAVTPVGQVMFVYDYFAHGTGDYFSVDSYTGQIDYADIPQYLSSKVDPESKAPVGLYELRDSLDFRPSVQTSNSHRQRVRLHLKIRTLKIQVHPQET